MKPEKYLKKAAKAEQEKILENGGDLLASLQAQIPQKKKRRVAVWLSVAASSLAVIIVAVCIGVFYPRRQDPPAYLESNITVSSSTLEDANENSDTFLFTLPENVQIHAFRAEDSVSGDTLYFRFQLYGQGTPFLYANILFLCNPAYHYLPMQTDFTLYQTVETDDYLLYFQNAGTDPTFPEIVSASGFILMGDENIHISVYEQVSSADMADEFIGFVQNFIRKK